MTRGPCRPPLRGPRRLLWPLYVVCRIWTSAVIDEAAIRFNLYLLATLTAVFSVPDLVQGAVGIAQGAPEGSRLYAAYVLALGLCEVCGALLLARRSAGGRVLILIAACGFYVEAALGLSGYERSVLALAIFSVSAPAEAWVIWFLSHPRVRAQVTSAGTASS